MRPLLFCSLLAVSLATIAPAAPVPTHLFPKEPRFAFPTKVGTTWVYEVFGKEQTLVISQSEDKPKGKLVTTEWVQADGKRTPHMVHLVTAEGVFMMAEVGEEYATPWCKIKFPHREGQSWKTETSRGPNRLNITATTTAGPVEQVKLPAGEFTAARVNCEFSFGVGPPIKTIWWYADGLGQIQQGLKSFKPGKD